MNRFMGKWEGPREIVALFHFCQSQENRAT